MRRRADRPALPRWAAVPEEESFTGVLSRPSPVFPRSQSQEISVTFAQTTRPTMNDENPSVTTPVTDAEIFRGHEGGKLSVAATRPISDPRDLSIAYTPGVAKVSRAIAEDASLAQRYT